MKIHSFEEFWPFYLTQHTKEGTRRLHFIGTGAAIILLLLALLTMDVWYLAAAIAAGYGFAWYGHFFIEQNRPATFRFPLYSLRADSRLFWMMLTRGVDNEDWSVREKKIRSRHEA